MGKLIRSRVLRGGVGLHEAPKGGDGARKISCHVGQSKDGVRQNHASLRSLDFGSNPRQI